jgi:hypothetical protein
MASQRSLTVMDIVGRRYRRTHTLLLDVVDDLTDQELRWQPQPPGNSAAWILWHLGRFADGFQVEVARAHAELADRLGDANEVWLVEHLAARWGLDAAKLGPTEAGIGMRSEDALNLRLPDKKALLDYVRRCFALADRAVEAVDDRHFATTYVSPYRERPTVTIGDTILAHLQHERYHLGQLRYLKKMMRRVS